MVVKSIIIVAVIIMGKTVLIDWIKMKDPIFSKINLFESSALNVITGIISSVHSNLQSIVLINNALLILLLKSILQMMLPDQSILVTKFHILNVITIA